MDGAGQPRQAAMAADRDRSQSAGRRDNYRIDTDEVQKTSISRVEVSTAAHGSRGDGERLHGLRTPAARILNRTGCLILLY